MKILAPVNSAREAKETIAAGADELYCGYIPAAWEKAYSNIASPNRREWKTANLSSREELPNIVETAHGHGVPVYLTMNALYTQQQYPLVVGEIRYAQALGVDALIIADVGLLSLLKKDGFRIPFHVSTGGTTFNAQTAAFFTLMGAERIVLPRHLRVDEIADIISRSPSQKFEVFILNSGCKNIDGFCTFHHGLQEKKHGRLWNIPKRYNWDRYFLNMMRFLPGPIASSLRPGVCGVDSACLLNYDVQLCRETASEASRFGRRPRAMINTLRRNFSLFSGIDPCGACRVADFKAAGVHGLKIVGRNYSLKKKIQDIIFLRRALRYAEDPGRSPGDLSRLIRTAFRDVYKFPCRRLCYYPHEDRSY